MLNVAQKVLLFPPKDLLELFFKNHGGKAELILQNMLDKLMISTVEVVKDPCMEELELLNHELAFCHIAADLSEINLDKILMVEFELNDILVLKTLFILFFIYNLVSKQLIQILFVFVLLLFFLEHPKPN